MTVNFTAHSVSLFIRVLKAVGYADVIEDMAQKEQKEVADLMKSAEAQAAQTKQLIGLIFKNTGYAEREINAFLSDVTGAKDIEKMGFKDYETLRKAVFEHEDFRDFFMSAQRTVADMFAALK